MEASRVVRVQARLKREKVHVTHERQSVRAAYQDLQAACVTHAQVLLRARHTYAAFARFLHNTIAWTDLETLLTQQVQANLVETHNVFSSHCSDVEKLIQFVYVHPQLLAHRVFLHWKQEEKSASASHSATHSTQSTHAHTADLLQTLFPSFYMNFFQPLDDHATCLFMQELMMLSLKGRKHPLLFLRKASPFSKAFELYVRAPGGAASRHIQTCLRNSLLSMLGQDGLDLEIDPTLVWSRLEENTRVDILGENHGAIPLTSAKLIAEPKFNALLVRVYDRLILFCKGIVSSLFESVHSLPYTIRYLCKCLYQELKLLPGVSRENALSCVGDLLFFRYICPAVAAPEASFIVQDTNMSDTAKRNVAIVSRLLKDMARGDLITNPPPYMAPLIGRLREIGRADMVKYFDKVLDIHDLEVTFGEGLKEASTHRGRKHFVLLSHEDLALVYRFLSSTVPQSPQEKDEALNALLDKLPSTMFSEDDRPKSDVIVFPLNDSNFIGGLLSEADVLAKVSASSKVPTTTPTVADQASEEPSQDKEKSRKSSTSSSMSVALSDKESGKRRAERIELISRRLRVALSDMTMNCEWQNLSLIEFLEADLAEASLLDQSSRVSQLQETLRHLKQAIHDGIPLAEILDHLHEEYKSRQAYVAYLTATKQSLLSSLENVQRQSLHLERAIESHMNYFLLLRVQRFVEQNTTSIEDMMDSFKLKDMIDEKASLVNTFIDQLYEKMVSEASWKNAVDSELDRAYSYLRKRVMCNIFRFAFFPHEEDSQKDNLFFNHIETDLAHIMPDHPLLLINKAHLSEAPWPSAQQHLKLMSAYKAPEDKLNCIVKCCNTIMNLLQLTGKSAGADDVFPILVYVILCANPPNLHSTMQYVRYFGEASISFGEAGYWWTQFCSAVTFIQSIDDRKDPSKPFAPSKPAAVAVAKASAAPSPQIAGNNPFFKSPPPSSPPSTGAN